MKLRQSSLGPQLIFLWSFAILLLRSKGPPENFLLALCHHCCIVFKYVGGLVFCRKKEANFLNWSHQAVDFISASLKNLLSDGKGNEQPVEGIISSLITRLVKGMCSPLKEDGADSESHHIEDDFQFCIRHLIRKLASEAYIGQRVILSVSQKISVLAKNLLFSDPFDVAFLSMHECMFLLIQLIEFLISDYFLTWSRDECFDNVIFEECVKSILHARKAVQLLESRNGLYVLYMDRVTRKLAKQVSQLSSSQKLNLDILDKLFL